MSSKLLHLDSLRQAFTKSLHLTLITNYNHLPTSERLAELFNDVQPLQIRISKETARLWLTGRTMPSAARMDKLNTLLGENLFHSVNAIPLALPHAQAGFKQELLAYAGHLPLDQQDMLLKLVKTLWRAAR